MKGSPDLQAFETWPRLHNSWIIWLQIFHCRSLEQNDQGQGHIQLKPLLQKLMENVSVMIKRSLIFLYLDWSVELRQKIIMKTLRLLGDIRPSLMKIQNFWFC